MPVVIERRPARTPIQQGISILPYALLFQRMHRRRWGMALAIAAALGGALWLARRSSTAED